MGRWDDLRSKLALGDAEVQTKAIEALVESVDEGVGLAVEALERGPNSFLIAERIGKLGSAYKDRLERVVRENKSSEPRVLAALLLVQKDQKSGEDELLRAIREDDDYAGLAAMTLARHQIRSVVPVITERLRTINLMDTDRVVALLTALEVLQVKAPEELVDRATREKAAWQVLSMLKAQPVSPSEN